MTAAYFDELAAHLRERGVPADEAAGTVDDLAAYAAESDADPEEEFGPAEIFAAQLSPGRAEAPAPEDGPAAQTWVWTADAFQDRALLDRYGDQGWEVERIDHLGRFVSRRAADGPLRWEYRRETVLGVGRRALTERLAPDGWEPCGTWMYFEYFKRPKAASEGPAGTLADVPETPSRRLFWSRRLYAFLGCYVAFLVALIVASVLWGDSMHGFLAGLATGAGIALLAAGVLMVRIRRNSR
ncbi:hypothetical protein [Actinomadura hibisca]|uniref:hypothetical protein n=1 Tax=Actinomadura hibisca TaxID=68565 RepID=UPI0008330113|nr:hypothetical protein [Actinomadura hibisca]